jgi:hypothetical protein
MAAATVTLFVNKYPSGQDTTQRRFSVYGRAVVATSAGTYVTGGLPLNFSSLIDESGQSVIVPATQSAPSYIKFDDYSGSGFEYTYNSQVGIPAVISAWSITSNVVTFTASNSLVAGQTVKISGLVNGAFLNGQVLTVSSTGLSGSAFEASFTAANASATEVGLALPTTSANVTAWSITSNVVTFTAANSYSIGQVVTVSGLTTGSYLNGKSFVVLSSGLSATQFEANFTHANASATENGVAQPQPTLQIFTTGTASGDALNELAASTIPSAVATANLKFHAEFIKNV